MNKTLPSGAGSGLSDDAYVGIGFSTIPILTVFVIACILAVIPLVLCSKRMRGPMVLGGNNSMVLSAAGHVVPVSGTRPPSPLSMRETGDGYEQVPLREPEEGAFRNHKQSASRKSEPGRGFESELDEGDKSEEEKHALIRISQSLVRWGVVKMPVSFYLQYADMDEPVSHLGFGAREHEVEEPVDGHWYA
jgi:hypothetical protein